ncbi:hypothetical protein YC2023_028672 [Brassica napus]
MQLDSAISVKLSALELDPIKEREKVDPGNPYVLVASSSALRSLELLRHEFWDLYKNCFHQRVLEGSLRICLYRPKPPPAPKLKNNNKHRRNQH